MKLVLFLTFLAAASAIPLIEYYCTFGGDFCGQSNTDDTHPSASIIILAFANILTNGTVINDDANYPTDLVNKWQSQQKSVLISIGGQNAIWTYVFANSTTMTNAINSINTILYSNNLDGVDLDIENYVTDPNIVAQWISKLKASIGNKIITVAPQCVGIYSGQVLTPGAWQAFNYWVPIFNSSINDIDLVLIQAYNNWYEQPAGTLAYLQDIYYNWRNIPSPFCSWCNVLPQFAGVPSQKIVFGMIASTSAGGSSYYVAPQIIQQFVSWLSTKNFSIAGIMTWDSHWDSLNGYTLSNAVIESSFNSSLSKGSNLLQE